ncbi:hypothetical protein LPJ73_002657 [Coemansia sp. RSA 2703]|nr:hypothetical protein LPJ73_002657 [Coemansia sp. RSA 2703]KAJ2395828.1 hypothetical protein GGI05_001400 [Coemansia sp. RSA 2603]
MSTSGKKDSGEMPSGVNNPYADQLATVAAVARVCEKRATAESSSAVESGVKEAVSTSNVNALVTQHDIQDFRRGVEEMCNLKRGQEEMHSMLEQMVISSPAGGHREPGPTDTPSPSRPGEQFGYGHSSLFHIPTMDVAETVSIADVCGSRSRATATSNKKKNRLNNY